MEPIPIQRGGQLHGVPSMWCADDQTGGRDNAGGQLLGDRDSRRGDADGRTGLASADRQRVGNRRAA